MKSKQLDPVPMDLPAHPVVSAYDAHEVLNAIHRAEETLLKDEPEKNIIVGALMSARMIIADIMRGAKL